MEDRIITSPVTGKRYKAIPNIQQILEKRNCCYGCAFNPDGTRASPNCTVMLEASRAGQDPAYVICGDKDYGVDCQIIWVEVDEHGNHIDNGGEIQVAETGKT